MLLISLFTANVSTYVCNQISVQIEKWVHSVKNQYLKTYSSFCTKTLLTCVETFVVNNDISYIRVHCVEPDLYGIKVVCTFFGTLFLGLCFIVRVRQHFL